MLFIYRHDYQGLAENPEEKGMTDLIIAKNRNGAVGEVHLEFRDSEAKFVDAEDSSLNYAKNSGAPIPSAGFSGGGRRVPLKDILPPTDGSGYGDGGSFGGGDGSFGGSFGDDNPFDGNTGFEI